MAVLSPPMRIGLKPSREKLMVKVSICFPDIGESRLASTSTCNPFASSARAEINPEIVRAPYLFFLCFLCRFQKF